MRVTDSAPNFRAFGSPGDSRDEGRLDVVETDGTVWNVPTDAVTLTATGYTLILEDGRHLHLPEASVRRIIDAKPAAQKSAPPGSP